MAPAPVPGTLKPAQWQAAIVALVVIACSWWVQSGLAALSEHRRERWRTLADFESLRREVVEKGAAGGDQIGGSLRDPRWNWLFGGLAPEVVQTHAGSFLILVATEQNVDGGRN